MSEEEKGLVIVKQAITADQFQNTRNDLINFVKSQLKEAKGFKNDKGYDDLTGGDYGIIPRTTKKSLLKPGAEKLLKLFGFVADFEIVKEIEDFEKGFVYYKYKCILTHGATGTFIASATRSCNSKEKKHASKPVYDVANTIEAVAQKRALVAATVQATMASEIFDADASGEYEEEAPNKSTTRDEDPRRNKITMRLYGTAKEHGWTDAWIHAAAKKKWQAESLTKLTNQQLEELTEFIVTTYETVSPGEKPKLREAKKPQAVEGDVIEEAQAKIAEKQAEMKQDDTTRRCADCSIGLPRDYDTALDKCKDCRMKEFLERGRKNKEAEVTV